MLKYKICFLKVLHHISSLTGQTSRYVINAKIGRQVVPELRASNIKDFRRKFSKSTQTAADWLVFPPSAVKL